jgi:hypothetical protein
MRARGGGGGNGIRADGRSRVGFCVGVPSGIFLWGGGGFSLVCVLSVCCVRVFLCVFCVCSVCVCVCISLCVLCVLSVCVCVCVREREREREQMDLCPTGTNHR